jgi:two-component system cell cycle response regulator
MARVLIIDDNHDNLDLMQYLLRAFGHEAITAHDGASGIAAALSESPDLVVCDIHMPGTDGYAVVQALRREARLRGVPIVAVSAMAMIGDSERALNSGFDGYISKPIGPETFIAQLDGFLPEDRRGIDPIRAHADAPPGSPMPRRTLPRAASVLVVDDSATNRELLVQILTPLGYEVLSAASVRQGLQLAQQSIPDLVLTDMHMPEQDGLQLLREMNAQTSLAGIPILVIASSAGTDQQRQAAFELGALRFLVRPIEPQSLADEIAACLAEGGAHGDNPGR